MSEEDLAKSGRLSQSEARELLERARAARGNAYAPYSRFPVGAALLDSGGKVHIGANVENASFGLTMCAERTALFRAIADGAKSFRAIAIAGPEADVPCPPCGACRQVLHEFAPQLTVVVEAAAGSVDLLSLRDLLPLAFGPDRLGSEAASHGAPGHSGPIVG